VRRDWPPLPMPTSAAAERTLLTSLRQIIVGWIGAGRESPLRKVVTFEDLVAAGLLTEETARQIAER